MSKNNSRLLRLQQCPNFILNCKSFSLESYDFHEHFVGRFIILKNASGVVLRKGKWFKFDAAFSSLIFLILFITKQVFRFLHLISTFVRPLACLPVEAGGFAGFIWILMALDFDLHCNLIHFSSLFFRPNNESKWIYISIIWKLSSASTCANKCTRWRPVFQENPITQQCTTLRSLASLNLHSKITSSLFSWK